MLTDLRLACRQIAAAPAFASVAILSLALGIGANTTVFSLVNELLLRSLPMQEPERLVLFRTLAGEGGGLAQSTEGYGHRDPASGRIASSSFSLAIFEGLREQRSVLSECFAFAPFWRANVLINGQPDPAASAQLASGSYHAGLGVKAWLGRTLTPAEDRPGSEPVAVISHRLWQRSFGGSADAIGRTFQLNTVTVTVVGVTPEGFAGAGQAGSYVDITVPLAHHLRFDPDGTDRDSPWCWWVRVMGRLAPGVTRPQAQAALTPTVVAAAREGWRLAPRRSATPQPADPALWVEPGYQGENDTRREFAKPLQLMQGLVALVLLAACANVANLLLARAVARRHEMAVRLALGAGRGRLVRQLLAESFLLAAISTVVGLLLAVGGRHLLVALRPFGGGVRIEVPLDGTVLAFTVAATVGTTLLFGLVPSLRATRLDLAREFQSGRTTAGSRSFLSRALVVTQIALALVLLVSTALVVRSLGNLERVDAGFNRRQLVVFRLDTASAGYDPNRGSALRVLLQERLAALPGVAGVTYARTALLSRGAQTTNAQVVGDGREGEAKPMNVHLHAVAPNFFSVTQLPLIRGRSFTPADDLGSARVAIVNEAFIRRHLNGTDPLGLRIRLGIDRTEIEIVGIARDAKYTDLRSAAPPTIYTAFLQNPAGAGNFLVRTHAEPAAMFDAIRATLRALDPTLSVLNLRTQDQQVARLHQQETLFAHLAGTFGALVLVLSAIGLAGLLSHAVARRTAEIGVRMALGAMPSRILKLFLSESLTLVAFGLGLGALAAWGVAHLFTPLLYGLEMFDLPAYGLASALLLAVALASSLAPALRAARIDPQDALRGN